MSEEISLYLVADGFGEKVGEATSLSEAISICPVCGVVYINLGAYARKIFYFG